MAGWLSRLLGRSSTNIPGFVYVKLPLAIMPIERGERFEDPIADELQRRSLGSVSGGGTLLSPPDENGKKTVIYCGIDVEAEDLDEVRAVLRGLLPSLGAPNQTALQFEIGDDPFEDVFNDGAWTLAVPQQIPEMDNRLE